jgi:transcriptional regulator GlxA family with amidase domain
MRRVVFLLVPGVHLLDLAGPAQVFSTAAGLGLRYELIYVAEAADITTAQGLTVHARTGWPDLTPQDLIVVPGWRAPNLADSGHLTTPTLRRLRDHHESGGTLVSVCAGADALGRAGLLDGRRCTTHHDVQDELARRHPKADVVRDVLYVVDGRIVTSAGIASGIDLALHLMAARTTSRAAPWPAPRTTIAVRPTPVPARPRRQPPRRSGTRCRLPPAGQPRWLRHGLRSSVHPNLDQYRSRRIERSPIRDPHPVGGRSDPHPHTIKHDHTHCDQAPHDQAPHNTSHNDPSHDQASTRTGPRA